jgi:membrane-bound lytic murein transglycosylase F
MINRLSLLKRRKQHRLIRILTLSIFLIVVALSIIINQYKAKHYQTVRTWEEIKKENILKVGILHNYTDYFVLQGEIYGFHYEMINKMAKHLDIEIEYKVYHNHKEYYKALLNNEVDILAVDAVPTFHSQILFDYTLPHSYSSIVLVQHKKKVLKHSTLKAKQAKQPIVIPASLGYIQSTDIPQNYSFTFEVSPLFSKQIVNEVNKGNIDRTLAYYKNINANTIFFQHLEYDHTVLENQALHWVIRKHNDSLLFAVNQWLADFTTSQSYQFLLKKHYSPSSSIRTLLKYQKNLFPLNDISSYDKIIQKYATKYQLDWLLVASLIYQESKFQADSKSKNTWGIMQFMPNTADYLGITIDDSPENQIEAGCRYLKILQDKYINLGVKDKDELMKFVLAAYNAGNCRIEDARKLARLYGLNENKWDNNVAVALKLLAKKNSPFHHELKCGRYSQAEHTIRYVDKILQRYYQYKNIVNYTLVE